MDMDKFAKQIELLARLEVGTGMSREDAAEVLHSVAEAIRTQDCAEDMSAITLDN